MHAPKRYGEGCGMRRRAALPARNRRRRAVEIGCASKGRVAEGMAAVWERANHMGSAAVQPVMPIAWHAVVVMLCAEGVPFLCSDQTIAPAPPLARTYALFLVTSARVWTLPPHASGGTSKPRAIAELG